MPAKSENEFCVELLENVVFMSAKSENEFCVELLENVFHLCMHGCNLLPKWNCVCMNRHN